MKPARKPARREEDALQRQQVEYLTVLENLGRLRFFAVPNGGKRSKVEASIMKGLGVRAGVPDLVILASQGMSAPTVFFIENKIGKNTLSKAQEEWEFWLDGNGFHHYVCRSFVEFLTLLHGWGIITARESGLARGAP